MTFIGLSGIIYDFSLHTWGATFKPLGAVYFITDRHPKKTGGHLHKAIYVGQTHDLSVRFDAHPKADCFKQHSANCICVLLEDDEAQRFVIEQDLIEN